MNTSGYRNHRNNLMLTVLTSLLVDDSENEFEARIQQLYDPDARLRWAERILGIERTQPAAAVPVHKISIMLRAGADFAVIRKNAKKPRRKHVSKLSAYQATLRMNGYERVEGDVTAGSVIEKWEKR